MKKVGIITIIDNNNYGNRLQNYALYKSLADYYEVETISYNIENDQKFLKKMYYRLRYYIHILKNIVLGKLTLNRIIAFKKFNKKIKFSKKNYSLKKMITADYDAFVVGSDQVWNPYHGRLTDFDVLKGIDSTKCYSYAASFGVSSVEENCKEKIKNEIGKFQRISVRENEGKDLLQTICKRNDVVVCLDPTMLLNQEKWDEIVNDCKISISQKYIFTYFLGGIPEEDYKNICEFAKENNLEIIDVLNNKTKYFNCGPEGFIYLIKNAEFVLTDSFHACVFSIIYHKKFNIFERKGINQSMNSRLNTLMKNLSIDSNILKSGEKIEFNDLNYELIDNKLESLKKESLDYLKKLFA